VAGQARYFCLEDLAKHIEATILDVFRPSCALPVILEEEDVHRLVRSTRHGIPAVRFVLSRVNNKYSYTTGSNDSLMKNLELFTRLAAKFRGRILYCLETGTRISDICT
jgi:BTB/POZ domain-containing adapter for CUL3-mediated RhoA degradation protein